MQVRVNQANFSDPRDTMAIVTLLNSYVSEPAGGGQPLPADVQRRVIPMLRVHPTALVLLAFADDEPVGVAVCFFGLSTFRARPLLNIHDLAVLPEFRGMGVGRALLAAAEEHARRKECCRLTLEVLDDNARARALYRRFGFTDTAETPATRFLTKSLDVPA